MKAYGLGGNAELAINAVTGNDQFEKIRTFLVSGANFDKDNPGVPISYTIRHLTDASQVKLALTTEYTAKDCVPQTTRLRQRPRLRQGARQVRRVRRQRHDVRRVRGDDASRPEARTART